MCQLKLDLGRNRMTTLMQKVINKYKGFLLVSIIMFLPVNMSSALSQEPSLFTAGAGAFDIFDDETTAEFRFEYIFPERQKIGAFTPFIGFSGTANSGSYVYSGVGLDLFFGSNFVVTPNFGVGLYGNGDGKDLGNPLEFRSGITFSARLVDYSRIGITFHHISNAGLNERNPGEESILVLYSIPIADLF